jgi:hypothetical protein
MIVRIVNCILLWICVLFLATATVIPSCPSGNANETFASVAAELDDTAEYNPGLSPLPSMGRGQGRREARSDRWRGEAPLTNDPSVMISSEESDPYADGCLLEQFEEAL